MGSNEVILTVLPQTNRISATQKCYLPSIYSKLLPNIGSFIIVQILSRKFVCKLCWKQDIHSSFCYVDFSVVINTEEEHALSKEDTTNLVNSNMTFDKIQILSDCIKIKKLKLTVVFEDISNKNKWQKNSGSLLDIVKETLKLYILTDDSTVYLNNLKSLKKFGIYCIVIHRIEENEAINVQRVGKVVSSTKVQIVCQKTKIWFEQLQSSQEILLGGLDLPYQSLMEIIKNNKLFNQTSGKLGIRPCRQVLLVGPSGCGKTSLVKYLAAKCKAVIVSVLGPEAYHPQPGDTENWLRNVFEEAFELAKEGFHNNGVCILLLDEIDSLCPRRSGDKPTYEVRASTQLLTLLERADKVDGLVVIATTNKPSLLDPAIRRPGRLETEIYIGVSTENERKQILQVLMLSSIELSDEEKIYLCEKVAHLTPGYVGADLSLLCQDVMFRRYRRKEMVSRCIMEEWLSDFRISVGRVRPTALRGGLGIVTTQTTQLSEIGGLDSVKRSLHAAIEWPLLYPDTFAKFGLPYTKGVLLYGPPGCAKTSLAQALAKAMNITFLSISAAELYSPYVGDAEKSVCELFHRSRLGAPTILFIDEIDALVGCRGYREKGVQERVLSALLTEMDGIGICVDSLSSINAKIGNAVVVMAATNRPDMLDDALLRPGRFDKLLYVPPPGPASRLDILKIVTANIPLGECVNLKSLVEKTELFSGADLKNLCREAALCALTEEGMQANSVKHKHFLEVLKYIHPSLSRSQIDWYKNFKK